MKNIELLGFIPFVIQVFYENGKGKKYWKLRRAIVKTLIHGWGVLIFAGVAWGCWGLLRMLMLFLYENQFLN